MNLPEMVSVAPNKDKLLVRTVDLDGVISLQD
jgi:hypothetical protein